MKKKFEVGKSYKCVENEGVSHLITVGNYYKVSKILSQASTIGVETCDKKQYWFWETRFDANDCLEDKNTQKIYVYAVVDHAGTLSVWDNEKAARDCVKYNDYGYVKGFEVKSVFDEEKKTNLRNEIKEHEHSIE